MIPGGSPPSLSTSSPSPCSPSPSTTPVTAAATRGRLRGRERRRVAAVSMVLTDTAVGAGLGLGLFGVLSIIRLRSREIEQSEMSYYLAALRDRPHRRPVDAGHVAERCRGQDPRGRRARDRRQPRRTAPFARAAVRAERAYLDETGLRAAVEHLLGTPVHRITTRNIDLVADTTVVDVRYSAPRPGSAPARQPRPFRR